MTRVKTDGRCDYMGGAVHNHECIADTGMHNTLRATKATPHEKVEMNGLGTCRRIMLLTEHTYRTHTYRHMPHNGIRRKAGMLAGTTRSMYTSISRHVHT